MPERPPLFRPAWWKPAPNRRNVKRHLTGRRLDRARALVFQYQPLCAVCQRAPSVELDHIVPLSLGGSDDGDNLQGLCKACHREKTARERAARDGSVEK